jgi:hypothetical protein
MGDIPIFLPVSAVAQILGVKTAVVNTLINSGTLRVFDDVHGKKVDVQSVILFLGEREFRRLWLKEGK